MPTPTETTHTTQDLINEVYNHKVTPNATYPKGATLGQLFQPARGERDSIPAMLLSAWSAGIVINLIGRPGVAKSAIPRYVADVMGADVIYFGPNSAPSTAAIPGIGSAEVDGETVEFIEYLLEEKLRSDRPKVVIFDEISRMSEGMRQQALEVLGPKPRVAGQEITNVIGRVCTGNRVDDGVDALDPALATRMVTLEVKASAVPWKYFVAADFPKVDLTDVYKAHDELAPDVREQVSPRKMRKIIWNLVNNGSGWPALAMVDGRYETFLDHNGNDVTKKVLDTFANALGVPNKDSLSNPLDAAITAVVEHGEGVYVEGPPGIGKTTEIEARIKAQRPDAKVLTISMANAAPEDWNLVMIQGGTLKRQLLKFFTDPGEKYLIADEVWRAPDDTMDMLLEVFQERTVAGQPTGLHGFIAVNNPRMVEGYQLDVGTPDSAQADRFTMSVTLTANDMGWRSYLINTYGDVAEHFIQWWEGLSAKDQVLYNVRVVETAIKWYLLGLSLDYTRPWYDGMPLDISFLELERALADRPLVRIKDVAARVDEFVAELSAPGGQETEAHRSVFDAFDRSDIVQLKAAREACVKLLPLLSQQAKINLLRSKDKDKRAFWLAVVNKKPAAA